MSESVIAPMRRAGFWRRAVCEFIDVNCVIVLLQIVGVLAYSLTGGVVQSRVGVAMKLSCSDAKIPDVVLEEKYYTVGATAEISPQVPGKLLCELSAFGLPQARWITVTQLSDERFHKIYVSKGRATPVTSRDQAIDAQGRNAPYLNLGLLLFPLFFLWRILVEGKGNRTPGRRIMRIRLMTQDGSAPTYGRIAERYAYQAGPSVLMGLITLLSFLAMSSYLRQNQASSISDFIPAMIVLILPVLATSIWALFDVIKRRDTYYDRAAGTCVIDDPA